MKKIDELLQFLWKRREDDRVYISKDIKYGHRNYYIKIEIDEEPEPIDNSSIVSNPRSGYGSLRGIFKGYNNTLSLHIDNRNNCIVLHYNNENIVMENDILVQKWSSVLEEYINNNNEEVFDVIIDKAFSDCYRKDFHRDWKIKKILSEEDESL
jgi:hypothetical protein